jgi:hypothetical protein
MPRGDGTGPAGFGAMTGRAAGYCAGNPVPGFMNPQPGFRGVGFGLGRGWGAGLGRGWGTGIGRGLGRGLGRGFGRGPMCGWLGPTGWMGVAYPNPAFQGVPFYDPAYPGYDPEYAAKATTEHEVAFLKEQAVFLKEELEAIEERLEELGQQEAGDTDKDNKDA